MKYKDLSQIEITVPENGAGHIEKARDVYPGHIFRFLGDETDGVYVRKAGVLETLSGREAVIGVSIKHGHQTIFMLDEEVEVLCKGFKLVKENDGDSS